MGFVNNMAHSTYHDTSRGSMGVPWYLKVHWSSHEKPWKSHVIMPWDRKVNPMGCYIGRPIGCLMGCPIISP